MREVVVRDTVTLALVLVLVLLEASGSLAADIKDAGYAAEIEKWRRARESSLVSDTGWLTVSGLFWLKDGANTFGRARGNDIVLPAPAPPRAGTLHFAQGRTTLRVAPGADVRIGGQPVTDRILRADTEGGGADVLELGTLSLQVIERGGRYGIRLRDTSSRRRRAFQGLL